MRSYVIIWVIHIHHKHHYSYGLKTNKQKKNLSGGPAATESLQVRECYTTCKRSSKQLHTYLEALHIRQRRLWCDHFVLCSIDLETLHHIQLYLCGFRSDFIGNAPLMLRPQLVRRHLACWWATWEMLKLDIFIFNNPLVITFTWSNSFICFTLTQHHPSYIVLFTAPSPPQPQA